MPARDRIGCESETSKLAKVKVHAGDWATGGDHMFSFGSFSLKKPGAWLHETVTADRLTRLEVASEEAVKRFGGAAGWGAVGALALGPVGLLAGVIMGGNKKDVTFVAEFDDGRKILATTDSKAFTKMQAAVFTKSNPRHSDLTAAAPNALPPVEEYQLSDRQRAEVAARMRESNKHSGMSDAELDTYEGLLKDGRSDEANDFFARCQSEMLVRIFINDGGMTEDEARRYLLAHAAADQDEMDAINKTSSERDRALDPIPKRSKKTAGK